MEYPNFVISGQSGNGMTQTEVTRIASTGRVYPARQYDAPTVRSKVSGVRWNDQDQQIKVDWMDFEGERYTFGTDCLLVPTPNESHRGAQRYGDSIHRSLVAYTAARADDRLGKVKDGDDPHVVDLILYLPPQLYNDYKAVVAERFKKHSAVEIHLDGENHPRRWVYRNIVVNLEGHVALFALGYDAKGNKAKNAPSIAGEGLVIDYGAGTMDLGAFVRGRVNPEYMEVSTFDNLGVYDNVLVPIATALRGIHPDFRTVTPEHVDAVLRNGFEFGDWTMNMGRASYNCKADILSQLDRLLAASKTVLDNHYHSLSVFSYVLVVGGIADYALSYLKERYPADRFLDLSSYSHLADIHPAWLNAVAGTRLYLHNLQKQKAT